jgi:ferredoxin
MWRKFTESAEYRDGGANPLDRWSRRVGQAVAAQLSATIIFPFEGPPYPPFLDWARGSGDAFPSPLSMFIHQRYGLWHAYRFALMFEASALGTGKQVFASSPCLSCTDQPCLNACPVNAFSSGKYRVDECMAYLSENTQSDCREGGCQARKNCPVAAENQYKQEHARFHMDAFVASDFLPEK